ncbi:MAG: endonuclease domain-containing protein [Clostridia bacterium]|nr:endonuclease domain-containing protein [Clostridia bacterium]
MNSFDKKQKFRDSSLRIRSQELRKNSTPEENHLWYDFLKTYKYTVRRQLPKDRFILDFYCSKAKLAIEIDGNQHFTEQGLAYDKERSAYLSEYGIKVLRFTNMEIRNNFVDVCKKIDDEISKRINLS